MFTTFTGNTRRPRNVNLSGRKTHAFGSSGAGSGTQAAVDRAQQERAQRQRERETKQAAQTIQRVWRGHSSRQKVADVLRHEWDAIEGGAALADKSTTVVPYASDEDALAQLRRLLRFSNTRNANDLWRIRHYGLRQMKTAETSFPPSGPWSAAYLRFEMVILAVIGRQTAAVGLKWDFFTDFIAILHTLTNQIPQETAQIAPRFYVTMAQVISKISTWDSSLGAESYESATFAQLTQRVLDITIKPLSIVPSQTREHTPHAYEAFGYLILPLPALSADPVSPITQQIRDDLADKINCRVLARALADMIRTSGLYAHPELRDVTARLRLLGTFIYFYRHAHNFGSSEAYSAQTDFVTVVSALLNSLPPSLVEDQVAEGDQVEDSDSTQLKQEVSSFLKDQVLSLVNQEGIGSLLSGSTTPSQASEEEKVEEARQLANYALALLRFFPRRGDEIRMWLYMGPSSSTKSSRSLPAIRYFWEAMKRSSVFKTILRDSRAAINLLRPNAEWSSVSSQTSPWQAPHQQLNQAALTADEWRVILVFLELYTFVLKVTDDEEFFSEAKDPFSDGVRENALPLSEVKDLTTFLKNLGFTLYFNASDITVSEEAETSSTGLSFFSPKVADSLPQREASEPSVGGVSGLSLDYIKGLVTGLLRMVYERDSRRRFLPSDHWLMTSRFDMTGFIPAVVEEEESRHRIEEEDAEDMDMDEEEFDDTPQLVGTSRTQQQRMQERRQRQQRKASRRRYLQAVAPRLEILQNMPFFIPFTTRVQIFREFVKLDMTKRRGSSDPDAWRFRLMHQPGDAFEKHHARIRREHEFEDAFTHYYPLGPGLKEPIQITFVDQFDAVEAGIDGGGVTKEFLTSVTNRAFESTDNIDMFVVNDQHLLYPNPSAVEELREALKQAGLTENSTEYRTQIQDFLQRYEFLGRIIGKCMYEGILVDVNFAPFFLRKWALTGGTGSAPKESGYRPSLNDLRDLDEELYKGLHDLKTYTGNVEDLCLNFTVTDTVVVDHRTNPRKTKTVTKELIKNGADLPVTNQNRLIYINRMVRHRLSDQAFVQTSAFLRGLSCMIEPSWLSMFNQSELQILVGGSSSSIDIDDLRRNTAYGGVYVIGDDGLEHPTVQLFWKVMKELSDGERRAVLKFVTSTPRAPLLGFGTLNPRFSIRDAGRAQDRLPSTSTCVNLLKLPIYKDENTLKEKLLYSVFSGAGFDLS